LVSDRLNGLMMSCALNLFALAVLIQQQQ